MHTSPPSRPSPITPTVDLDRDGVQHGICGCHGRGTIPPGDR